MKWKVSPPDGPPVESQSLFFGGTAAAAVEMFNKFTITILNGTTLRSAISFENVTADLNGTTISCLELIGNEMTNTIASTRIQVTGHEAYHSKLS